MSNENFIEKKEHKIGFTLMGVIVILLAIVGLISVISSAIDLTYNIINKTNEKKELANYIYPFVIMDIPSFETADTLTDTTVINSAIWDIILAKETDKYVVDDDCYLVPSVDIEKSIAKLYGSNRTVIHQTTGDLELSFIYDEESASYRVPNNISYYPYYPYIDSFTKDGNLLTLNVGYVTASNYLLEETKTPKAQKYMTYVIEDNGNSKKIVSISIQSDATIGGN